MKTEIVKLGGQWFWQLLDSRGKHIASGRKTNKIAATNAAWQRKQAILDRLKY